MRMCIWLVACAFAEPALASGASAFVVNSGDRAYQESVLRRAAAVAVTDSAFITVCGAGLSMLSNSNIEANVLLERAKAAGVQIRQCGSAMVRRVAPAHNVRGAKLPLSSTSMER